ncbi:hypothetical protein Nepgr_024736 [Nepenthes gracilis]|uniref:Uncharacterized protein n=1 Tax=Nepenthes gracilis TaxID=150966 RepID=A0AAD3T3F1_NEPGR|nr:hypothetical protein Nepgr_024736 [Nepenthes gracilis]
MLVSVGLQLFGLRGGGGQNYRPMADDKCCCGCYARLLAAPAGMFSVKFGLGFYCETLNLESAVWSAFCKKLAAILVWNGLPCPWPPPWFNYTGLDLHSGWVVSVILVLLLIS